MFTTLTHTLRKFSYSSRGRIYIGGCLIYTVFETYNDIEIHLRNFRENTLSDVIPSYHAKRIKTEWDAIKYGAEQNVWIRYWESFVWPVHIIRIIMPSIVLIFNPAPKNN